MIDTPGRRAAVVLAVVALFVTPAAALALPAGDRSQVAQADNETVLPGERLSGVVGVQGAEVDSSVEGRAFGQSVAAAASNESKAAVVAERVDRLETRLTELREQREQLQAARDNGSISDGAYQARTASLAARIEGVQEQLNHSQAVTATLPEQARRGAGLDAGRIETLRSQAHNLSGGEVAEIARSVAGPGVGRGVPAGQGGGPPAGIPGGPGSGMGNGGPGNGMGGPGGNGQGGPGTGGPGNGMGGNGPGGPPADTDRGGSPNGTATDN